MIESIELKNWKTHLDSRLEFGKGTNVLVGQMGSGKSSVMDAICFALFGTFPALQARRLSIEEVIMNKPAEAEEASVRLGFSYFGKSYSVERRIKRKGSSEAKLYCSGRAVAGPKPKDVNDAVERAIEMNYNLFTRAVYSEQNGIDYFLRITPKERKEKFDELLDLERYEQVRANAVTALNRLKSISRDRKALASEQRAGISEEEEKRLSQGIGEKEKENRQLEQKAKTGKVGLAALEKEVAFLEEKEASFRRAAEELAQKSAVLEEVLAEIQETRKKSGGKKPEALEAEIKSASKQIEALQEREKKAEGDSEQEEKLRESFGKEAMLRQNKEEELNARLREIKGLGAECPTCRQRLEEKTRKALVLETEKEVERNQSEKKLFIGREKEAAERAKLLKETLREETRRRECLKERRLELQHLLVEMQRLEEKEKRAKLLKEQREKAEEGLKGMRFDEKELLLKRKQALEEKVKIQASERAIESNKALVLELRAGLGRIEKARAQVKELEERIKNIDLSAEKMSYFINSLVSAQKGLRELLVATINEAMHDIWQKIYPYRDFVSAKMDIEEGSYELKAMERNGRWVRVDGILSGGERSAAAVCIRIAFSLVLARNLSWLILDEPTHNLDRKAVETLADMMQLHLPKLVEQVFVITHDREMEKAASARLYCLEREKGEDGFTRPVEIALQD